MKFYIYGRKSVYTGKGESIASQIKMCKDYIEARFGSGHDMQTYEDEGFSGGSTARPMFRKMLNDILSNKPDCIVCYRLDRISRSVSDFSALIEYLNKQEIAFICIKEEFDTSRPMGKAMMYIASVFAQLERETIAERVRDNMLMLARSGRWLGGVPPTGYASRKIQYDTEDGRKISYCTLEELHEEAEMVKFIYSEYLISHSLSHVRAALKTRGARPRAGTEFSAAALKQILLNPVYCAADSCAHAYFTSKGADVCFNEEDFAKKRGIIAYNKRDYRKNGAPDKQESEWVIALGTHDGLIDGEMWTAVRKIMNEKASKRILQPHSTYSLLSGLLFCAKCGAPMYPKARRKSEGGCSGSVEFDYICGSKLKSGKKACTCRNLNGRTADLSVLSALACALYDASLCDADLYDTSLHGRRLYDKRSKNNIEYHASAYKNISHYEQFTNKNDLYFTFESDFLRQSIINLKCEEADISSRTYFEWRGDAVPEGAELLLEYSDADVCEIKRITRQFLKKAEWDGEALHIF